MDQDRDLAQDEEEGHIGRNIPTIQDLFLLYFRPLKFFDATVIYGKLPYMMFALWIIGVSNTIGRIDSELVKMDMNASKIGLLSAFPQLVDSWVVFWTVTSVIGMFSGLMLWLVGGWWYNVRIDWCGARDHDTHLGKVVYIYTSFIYALPAIVLCVIYSAVFPDYRTAFHADEYFSLFSLAFIFWGVVNSYRSVRTIFDINNRKTLVWFLILPFVVYVLALGLIATAYAFLSK